MQKHSENAETDTCDNNVLANRCENLKKDFLDRLKKAYLMHIEYLNSHTTKYEEQFFGMRLFCMDCKLLTFDEISEMMKSVDNNNV